MNKVYSPLRIVTCPRSGSLYTTKLLRSKGWKIGWEHHNEQGICSWMSVVRSEWVPFGDGSNLDYVYGTTFAVVRDPFKTIWSITKTCLAGASLKPFLEFTRTFINLPDENHLTMATRFYLQWMERVEQEAEAIFHTGDKAMFLTAVYDTLGHPGHPLESMPKSDVHSVCSSHPTREQILQRLPAYLGEQLLEKTFYLGF